MAKHVPPDKDFVPWAERLAQWWKQHKAVRQMNKEMKSTRCWDDFRTFYDDDHES